MALYINSGKGFEKLPVAEALNLLGVTGKLPSQTIRQFEFARSRRRKTSKGVLVPRSWTSKPEFIVYVPKLGVEVTIRWATTHRRATDPNGMGTVDQFAPKHISFEGTAISVQDDDSQFAWWFLHPNNKQSPFRKHNSSYYWEFTDMVADAEEDIASVEASTRALSLIVGDKALDPISLRILAKGMGINGVDGMDLKVVQGLLIRMAKVNPVEFYNKAYSNSIPFNGMLQEAVDKRIIILHNTNGMYRWHFGETELCIVSNSVENPIETLREFVTNNMHLWFGKIKDAVENHHKEQKIESPEFSKYFTKPGERAEMPADIGKEGEKMAKMVDNELEWEGELDRLSKIDPDDPKTHHMTREKILRLKPQIEAYKEKMKMAAGTAV